MLNRRDKVGMKLVLEIFLLVGFTSWQRKKKEEKKITKIKQVLKDKKTKCFLGPPISLIKV